MKNERGADFCYVMPVNQKINLDELAKFINGCKDYGAYEFEVSIKESMTTGNRIALDLFCKTDKQQVEEMKARIEQLENELAKLKDPHKRLNFGALNFATAASAIIKR